MHVLQRDLGGLLGEIVFISLLIKKYFYFFLKKKIEMYWRMWSARITARLRGAFGRDSVYQSIN